LEEGGRIIRPFLRLEEGGTDLFKIGETGGQDLF
jgi:hypothetical protein